MIRPYSLVGAHYKREREAPRPRAGLCEQLRAAGPRKWAGIYAGTNKEQRSEEGWQTNWGNRFEIARRLWNRHFFVYLRERDYSPFYFLFFINDIPIICAASRNLWNDGRASARRPDICRCREVGFRRLVCSYLWELTNRFSDVGGFYFVRYELVIRPVNVYD